MVTVCALVWCIISEDSPCAWPSLCFVFLRLVYGGWVLQASMVCPWGVNAIGCFLPDWTHTP
ncbi:MAG: hypothetical protein RIS47_948 [Bacteroidota bacterium]|jgi:hypothetical protein